jgi:hypothetical protein
MTFLQHVAEALFVKSTSPIQCTCEYTSNTPCQIDITALYTLYIDENTHVVGHVEVSAWRMFTVVFSLTYALTYIFQYQNVVMYFQTHALLCCIYLVLLPFKAGTVEMLISSHFYWLTRNFSMFRFVGFKCLIPDIPLHCQAYLLILPEIYIRSMTTVRWCPFCYITVHELSEPFTQSITCISFLCYFC